jgi:hypothetical protein
VLKLKISGNFPIGEQIRRLGTCEARSRIRPLVAAEAGGSARIVHSLPIQLL